MKTIGLGGTAWYATVDYYRYINKAVNDAFGDNTNSPLIVYNLNQQRIQDLQAKNQWEEVAAIDADAALRLRASGAQAILLCSNTQHKVYAQAARQLDIPILHIGDATGIAIQKAGLKKVGLIGTRFTMEDGFMAALSASMGRVQFRADKRKGQVSIALARPVQRSCSGSASQEKRTAKSPAV